MKNYILVGTASLMLILFSSIYSFLYGKEGNDNILNEARALAQEHATNELKNNNLTLMAESYMGSKIANIPGLDEEKYLNCLSTLVSLKFYKDNADFEPNLTELEKIQQLKYTPEKSRHYASTFNEVKLSAIRKHPDVNCIF
ncbi:hypothetical protein ACJJIR_00195 [Microbulbifer sp. SSSA008]|uniref:hypothetical protein n=1 Tax=Microbulbifer sp. SSSA008 TaxID=3243380 RepID=UPI00403A44C1